MTPEPLTEKRNHADDLSLPPGFKMTELGPLPEEWQVVRLGEVADKPQYGYTASAVQEALGPRFLRITDIQEDKVYWPSVPFCVITDNKELERYRLENGDLLVTRIGATTGKTYLVNECPLSIFASYLIRVRVKKDYLNADYLYFFTRTDQYWKQINASKGGRLKGGLNIPVLTSLLVPLPPLPEQQAIAHVLRTVQGAKEAAARVIQAARELKKSLMRHLFTYGPVPLDQVHRVPLRETDLGPLPAHWQVVRLGEVAETTTGGTPRRDTPSFFGGSIPWVKSSELRDSWITNTEETITEAGLENSNARLLPSNTLLIAMYGATAGKVGILRLPATTNQAICAVLPNQTLASNEYLFYVFIFLRKKLLDQRFGGAQPNLNQTTIRSFPIPLPPLPEQKAIARILQAVDRKIAAEEARQQALEALFKTLLHHLMTGQVRVVPPTAEAAE
ncbi:restriction endonuclease subunit S [Thermanaerothrix sp.]|uniref:restriction endonuclease subunit S n=1 Tax=Thermanaerothrix sp. TaxID=2972675 RepID=UPI002ADE8201|nr:restriction endonuclease subunit S [Thermanaerothrix sp.]